MLYSLRGRVAAAYVVLLAATFLALGLVLTGQARHEATRDLERRLSTEAAAIAASAAPGLSGAPGATPIAADAQRIASRENAVLVVRADGASAFDSAPGGVPADARAPEIAQALTGQPSQAVRTNPVSDRSELHVAVPVVLDGKTVGAVRVTGSREAVGEAARRVAARLAVIGAIALVAGGALLLWVTAPLRRALDALAAVARRLASGHLYERAPVPSVGEAEELAAAVNEMAASLEEQVTRSYRERDTMGALIESMADALLVVNNEDNVALINPAAGRLFGVDAAGAVGKRLIEVVRDHEILRLVSETLHAGRHHAGQVEFGRDPRLLRISVTPLQERGRLSALVLIQDFTEVQRLQGVRREFVANVSHELRTPLASIKAAAEALEGGALGEPEAARDFLGRINTEVDHLTELVQHLLDLSQVETGRARFEMKRLDLKPLLLEAIDRVRPQIERQGLQLQVELPDGLPQVTADRAAVHQVLLNLIDNALKFTRQGHIRVSARRDDSVAEVVVEDTGAGIGPEHLPHIFERFYKADRSRSSAGAGLGLALAKHNVQAHGGRIWAESEPGRGAAVHFTLPVAGSPPP